MTEAACRRRDTGPPTTPSCHTAPEALGRLGTRLRTCTMIRSIGSRPHSRHRCLHAGAAPAAARPRAPYGQQRQFEQKVFPSPLALFAEGWDTTSKPAPARDSRVIGSVWLEGAAAATAWCVTPSAHGHLGLAGVDGRCWGLPPARHHASCDAEGPCFLLGPCLAGPGIHLLPWHCDLVGPGKPRRPSGDGTSKWGACPCCRRCLGRAQSSAGHHSSLCS